MQQSATNGHRLIGTFTLSLLSISAIISLRHFPVMAAQGYASIFFYSLAALFFFIPTALVAAELVSGWPGKGGVYHWVTQAFGQKAGGVAVWLEWIEGVVWLPTVLSFIAATIAYVAEPLLGLPANTLSRNPSYLVSTMLIILWSFTLINCLGIKTSSRVSSLGVLLGSIIPSLMIIALGAFWFADGRALEIAFTPESLLPSFSFDSFVFLTGVFLSFGGIEVAAYHIQDTQHPQKTFVKATFIAAAVILSLYVLGSLAIAYVIPKDQLNLFSGVMQAITFFFTALHLPQWVGAFGLMILIGAFALLNTWIIGPSRGLLVSVEDGNLPAYFKKVNRFGAPARILIAQALLGSILASVFFLMPTLNSSYWILIALTSQLILLMYIMIFFSAIRLRLTHPHTPRAYRIPGGKQWGMFLVAGFGIVASIITFFIGFIPTPDIPEAGRWIYVEALAIGVVVLSLPPFFVGNHSSGFQKKQSMRT